MKGLQLTKGSRTLYLAFGIPFLLMLVLFIVHRIYPFGDRSFLYSDMYHQYMPFFCEFLHKIRTGEGLGFSYNVGIGSNFLALYVYYLASPLNWLALLVPEAFLMEFMSYLVVLRVGLCGWSFAYYLQKHFSSDNVSVVLFAIFYAFSGYMAAYNWNIMWLDCIILFPLILLGLERLVKEGKCVLYCVSLALCIWTNYYISIMICMFLVIYFFYLLLADGPAWKKIGKFALYSLLAGGMAAALLVPEVCAIIKTDFGDVSFPEKLESYFSVLDMLARHCMFVSAERGLDHWPNIYCGVAVFVLMPLFVTNEKISLRRRFGLLVMAGVMLLGFSTNMLDFIWHGLNYPDSLPARQSFIYIFLILVMCYEAWHHIETVQPKTICYSFMAAVGFLLFVEKFVEHEDFATGVEVLNFAFVAVYAILLYFYCTRKDETWKRVVAYLALIVVILEAAFNTSYTSLGTTSRSAYLGQLQDYENLYEYTKAQEDSLYRIEKFARKTKNDGTLVGYPTASVFSSTMNSHVMDLYKALGMRHSKVYYGFDGATAFTAALLNVNYMFGEGEQYENALYELLESSGDISLYESKVTLPFGYVAPTGYDVETDTQTAGIRLQNNLVKDLGVSGKLLEKVSAKASNDDVRLVAEEAGIYYGVVTASGTKKIEIIGGQMDGHVFNDLKNGAILYLGHLDVGKTLTLTNGDENDESQQIKVDAYRLNEDVLKEAIDTLSKQHLKEVVYDSDYLTGNLHLEEAGRLILSIPYEDGWIVYLNGTEVEPQLFGGALIAIDLEAGDYSIEMKYTPAGAYAGVFISIVSIGIFVAICLLRKRNAKNATVVTHIPHNHEEEVLQ